MGDHSYAQTEADSNAQAEWRGNMDMGDHSYAQTEAESERSCANQYCDQNDVCRGYRGYLIRISTGGPYWSNSRTDFSDVPTCSTDVYKNRAA